MATDASDVLSTSTVTGLVVAGLSLGAVYALNYTRLGKVLGVGDTRSDGHTQGGVASGEKGMGKEGTGGGGGVKRAGAAVGTGAGTSRKGGRRRKGKGKGKSEGEAKVGDEAGDEGEGKGQDGGTGQDSTAAPRIIPGDFEPVNTDVAPASSPAETTAHPLGVPSVKTQKKKKQKQRKHKKQTQARDEDEGSETGRDVDVARDSTDASRSLSPSVSGDKALPSASRAVPGKATLGASGTRLVPPRAHAPLQPRPSLSFDTDSSWTHVDRRGLKSSKSTDGEGQGQGMDMTSSDVASTPSESPVVERMGSDATDVRGARGEVPRTLAERLVPRPRKTGVEDMLEQSDFPTLARVLRVQPPTDETPVPGFSWEDYGDVVEESVLAHDADEEDEGEWGVVKSRHRTRSLQTTTTASTSTPAPAATPETMTKKQRQNARKRELAKSAKAETEAARLQGLAKHQRELERLRIIEQSQQGGGKRPSGGMNATVDDRGNLVWE